MADKYSQEQYFGKPSKLTQQQIEAASELVAKTVASNDQNGRLSESDRVGAGLVGQQAKDTGIVKS